MRREQDDTGDVPRRDREEDNVKQKLQGVDANQKQEGEEPLTNGTYPEQKQSWRAHRAHQERRKQDVHASGHRLRANGNPRSIP